MAKASPNSSCSLRFLRERINLNSHFLEFELLLLAMAIGIQDAISFPEYHCFASNQTGNTVLFAVGALQVSTASTGDVGALFSIKTLGVSLSMFVGGVLVCGEMGNILKASDQRWWLILSSTLQTAMVFAAAVLQWEHNDEIGPDTDLGRVVVGLLAFAAGAQVGMVRALKITEITTAMATAAYVDLFIDEKVLAGVTRNRPRNRRALFLVVLVIGSFIGAVIYKYYGAGLALAISGAVKILVTVMFLLNRSAKEPELEDADS